MNNAIIIDLDGTLAIMGKRDPYDVSKANELDSINEAVRIIISSYLKYNENNKVIFLTGRPEKYEQNTIGFINRCGFYEYTLFMRLNDDWRKSEIYKKDVYDNYIKEKFKIDFVMDDNSKVINMFRGLGLICFALEEKMIER